MISRRLFKVRPKEWGKIYEMLEVLQNDRLALDECLSDLASMMSVEKFVYPLGFTFPGPRQFTFYLLSKILDLSG